MKDNELANMIKKILSEYPELLSLEQSDKKAFFQILEKEMSSASYNISLPKDMLVTEEEQRYSINTKNLSHNFPGKAAFLETVKEEYKKPTATAIELFTAYTNEMMISFPDITPEFVQQFITYLYKQGKSQSSVRVIFSRINQYYDFLVAHEYMPLGCNPCSSIKFSEIKYEPGKQSSIPTEEEILVIINSLPVHLAAICAVTAIKGYSVSQLYDLTFVNSTIVRKNSEKNISVTYCFTLTDVWDIFPEKNDPEAEQYDTIDPFGFKPYYEYTIQPAWYNVVMNNFWNFVTENTTNDPEIMGPGEFFFTNSEINLRSYENAITKHIRQLFTEGKISSPYTLKHLRLYAVRQTYEKYHDLKKIQKLLQHTSLNTTRRFMQNIGIEFSDI